MYNKRLAVTLLTYNHPAFSSVIGYLQVSVNITAYYIYTTFKVTL